MSANRSRYDVDGCDLSRPLLSEWIDKDLPPAIAQSVLGHVSACPRCRRLAVSLRAVVADVAGLAEAKDEPQGGNMRPPLHPLPGSGASNES